MYGILIGWYGHHSLLYGAVYILACAWIVWCVVLSVPIRFYTSMYPELVKAKKVVHEVFCLYFAKMFCKECISFGAIPAQYVMFWCLEICQKYIFFYKIHTYQYLLIIFQVGWSRDSIPEQGVQTRRYGNVGYLEKNISRTRTWNEETCGKWTNNNNVSQIYQKTASNKLTCWFVAWERTHQTTSTHMWSMSKLGLKFELKCREVKLLSIHKGIILFWSLYD